MKINLIILIIFGLLILSKLKIRKEKFNFDTECKNKFTQQNYQAENVQGKLNLLTKFISNSTNLDENDKDKAMDISGNSLLYDIVPDERNTSLINSYLSNERPQNIENKKFSVLIPNVSCINGSELNETCNLKLDEPSEIKLHYKNKPMEEFNRDRMDSDLNYCNTNIINCREIYNREPFKLRINENNEAETIFNGCNFLN